MAGTTQGTRSMERCGWCLGDPLYIDYHDREWGVPETRSLALFEALVLDGAQAGLSWITILRKRENYRRAFDGFDPAKIARYGARKRAALLADPGIVRNRQKVDAAISNARCYVEIEASGNSFSNFIWSFVDGVPVQNRWRSPAEIPAETGQSHRMAKELKRLGFRFVGPTICYAFMQAAGLVNDHLVTCPRYEACGGFASPGTMTRGR